jgi:hypothetical protein
MVVVFYLYIFHILFTVQIVATTPRKIRGFLIMAKRVDPKLNTNDAIGYFTQNQGTKFVCTSNYGVSFDYG